MSNHSRKLVIGGGISGLVWAYFHPEYEIITPDVGGSYGKNHLVWLHDTPETRYLLKKLGFSDSEIRTKKSHIGYHRNGWLYDNVTPEFRELLIKKKMSNWNEKIDMGVKLDSNKMSMSGGEVDVNYMNSLDVDLVEVIRRLNGQVKMTKGFVTKIDGNQVYFKIDPSSEELSSLEYDSLVSTIPAPFFWIAYGKPEMESDFKYLPITNIVTPDKPVEFDNRYEMAYYVDTPFSRASYLDGKYALEFTGFVPREELEKMYPNLRIEQYFVVKHGRIFKNEKNIPPQDNIKFLGRFGLWEYGVTTEHVVRESIHSNF